MLDRLPTELLLHILELAAPLEYSSSYDDDERHDLLLACSLVSKKLCAIAQPMLPQVYRIGGLWDILQLKVVEHGVKRGRKVKLLVLALLLLDEQHDITNLSRLVKWMPLLTDIRLVQGEGVYDLSILAKLPALRHLVVFSVDLCAFSKPNAVFPNLIELSIVNATADSSIFSTFPSARQTPALRAFGIADTEVVWSHTVWPPNLDVFELTDDSAPPSDTVEMHDSTLVVYEESLGASTLDSSILPLNLPIALCFHRGITDYFSTPAANEDESLQELISKLEDLPTLPSDTSLRYLSLPAPLRLVPALDPLIHEITRTWTSKGVELYWDVAPELEHGSTVSPALWRRARELKRELQ